MTNPKFIDKAEIIPFMEQSGLAPDSEFWIWMLAVCRDYTYHRHSEIVMIFLDSFAGL